MIDMGDRFDGLKKGYILFILTICYIIGELGHYLIGSSSRATAKDVHYGDHACQLANASFIENDNITRCESIRYFIHS
jgi:hypothetical protein